MFFVGDYVQIIPAGWGSVQFPFCARGFSLALFSCCLLFWVGFADDYGDFWDFWDFSFRAGLAGCFSLEIMCRSSLRDGGACGFRSALAGFSCSFRLPYAVVGSASPTIMGIMEISGIFLFVPGL
jgi:hypothetical protein